MERRNSIILSIIAASAFATVLFGFARIDAGDGRTQTLAEEKQQLVESAQLWYVRPVVKGGGGMTFDSLDFSRLGCHHPNGSLHYESKLALYWIEDRQSSSFLLGSRMFSGEIDGLDTIRFDSQPR